MSDAFSGVSHNAFMWYAAVIRPKMAAFPSLFGLFNKYFFTGT